ncbi:MAG TPA: hypothetical protein VFK78_12355 [Gemmatimonadales bacterium]|nr:hypothetical protein [Gemmatimonadales bacterium]
MTRGVRMLLAALALAGVAGCKSDGISGPVSGNLKIKLTTPNVGDGAVMFTLTGPVAITDTASGASARVFAGPLGGLTTKFIVTGTLANGATIMTVGVVDVNKVAEYTATIQQVAVSSDHSLRALSGYKLSVTR